MRLGFPLSRFAIGYIALGMVALAMFAVLLWYGYRTNLGTFRAYVPGAEMQRLAEIFHRDGARAVADAVDAYLPSLPRDELIVFADPQKQRLAGSLPAWPAEVPDVPGTYGLVIGTSGAAPMRVVTSHVTLPGGYALLMGRESVRFQSLVERFWYGIVAAMAAVLALGALIAWRSRRALVADEQRFALAVAGAKDGVWDWDLSSGMIYISPRGQKILTGRAAEGSDVRHADEWARHYRLHPDDEPRRKAAVREHLAGRTPYYEGEWRVLHPDGTHHWVHSRGVCMRDASGRAVRFAGSSTDIDERKRGELALAESEARFRSLSELSNDFFWETDAEHRYTAIELGWAYRGVRNNASKLGFARWEIPYASPDEAAWAAHRAAIAARSRFIDFRFSRIENGEERFYEHSGEPRYDAQGTFLGYRGVGRDVTERMRAAEALRESEKRYERVMLASNAGIWDWDVATDKYYASPRFLELCGIPPDTTFSSREEFVRHRPIHPEDREKWEQAVKALFASRDSRVSMEVRSVVNGEPRWRRLEGICFRDATGKVVRWTGTSTDITERKRIEASLIQSEERYARVMQASEDGFWEWVVATDEFYASPRMLALYGLPPDTVFRGRAEFLSRFPFHPEDLKLWHEAVAAHLAGQTARIDMEVRAKVRSETRWIHLSAVCQRDASGAEERWTGSVSDVTERRRAQEASRVSEERYARAMEGSDAGHWDWNIVSDEMFVSERAREMLALPAGPLPARRADIMERVPMHPEDRAAMADVVKAGIESGIHERDYRVMPRASEVRWLRSRGKIYKDARGAAVRMTGSLIDITDSKLAADALRASEERYERAMEATEAGHWEWDLVTHQVFHSPRFRELYGISPGETFADRDAWKARQPVSASERERQERALQAAIADPSKSYDIELSFEVAPGQVRWLRSRGKVFRAADGRPLRVTGATTDITVRKLAQEALRLSEERYALAVAGASDGIWDEDLATGMLYRSPRNQEMVLGRPSDGIDVRRRAEWAQWHYVHPDDAPKRDAAIRAHLEGRTPLYEIEYRVRHQDGTYHWIHARGVCTRDGSGRALRFAGSTTDIDARKAAEGALRASEERYALAMEVAEEGHFDWNVQTDEIFASARALSVIGVPPDGDYRTRSDVMARVRYHPDDEARIQLEWRAALAGQGVEHEFEYRVLRGEEPRWIRGRWKVFRDAAGTALRVIGVIADITARKLAEEALRRSEHALRLSEERYSLALQASAEGHFDTDLETGEIFVSARLNEIYGFARPAESANRIEFLARIPFHPDDRHVLDDIIRPDWDDPASLERLRLGHLVAHVPRDSYEFECRIVPRPGEIRWIHTRGKVLRDADGRARRRVGVVADITARKRAEEGLRLSEERYALAMEASEEGHFDWEVQTDEIFASAQMKRVLGLPADKEYRTRGEMSAHVRYCPGDLERLEQRNRDVLGGPALLDEFEYRILRGDETRWLRRRWKIFRDGAGAALRVIGVITDITERKLAADELRESEARFRSLVELSSDWYWKQDENLRFVSYVPPEVGTRSGVAAGASLGKARWEFDNITPLSSSWEEHKAVLAARQPFRDFEYLRLDENGTPHYTVISGVPTFDGDGRFTGYEGVGRDISERKRFEEELRSRQEMLELAQKSARAIAFEWRIGADGPDQNRWSPELAAMYGVAPGSYDGSFEQWQKLIHPEDWPVVKEAIKHAQRTGEVAAEYRVVHPDGSVHWLQAKGRMFFDAGRKPVRMVGFMHDVTARKRVEEALRVSEERYAYAMEAAQDAHWDFIIGTDQYYTSPRVVDIFGLPRGTTFTSRLDYLAKTPLVKEDLEAWTRKAHELFAGTGSRLSMDLRAIINGEVRWIQHNGLCVRDAAGRAVRWCGSVRDVTERRRAEDDLRRSQHYLAEAQRLSHIGSWAFTAAGFGYWSPELFNIHGLDPGGKAPSIPEYLALVHPEDRDFVVQEIEKVLAGADGFDFKKRIVRPDGAIRLVRCVGVRASTGGNVEEFVGSGMDVTEQERAQEELRRSEERFALAVEGSNEGIFDWDLASDRVYVSYRAQELFGLPRGELWRPRRDWRHIVSFHPDDAPRLHDAIKAHIEGGAPTYDQEFRIVASGGGVRWFRQRSIALRDASGKAYRVVGSIGDVTEKHIVEEELKALERKLRLAQRLEAMGTLAGGIAHDFNNILGAILGYGEMAMRDAPKGSRLARDLDSIVVAGERGRALVDRVLAFSRSGVGERVPVHVEKVVREALDLVSAKLPPDVTLHAKLHAGRAAMLGDATQVHQVLTNLASNAIQAMPAGGTLRVSLRVERFEAARAPSIGILDPGNYLVLEVADTGTGIAPEILDRIFDPFFTTKEVGTGTGLGLSLVHGIVAEVGGAIDVASRLGAGSTFTVYLPRTGDAEDSSQRVEPELPRGDGQRVLVVDDEEPLVKLATRTLQDLGYAPVGFTSSTAALAAFRADPQRFDALITDERMPGMSGSALIREVRGIRDRIPIVLMSGYVGGTVATRAREAGAEEVLKKPLSARDLATSLARVLHS